MTQSDPKDREWIANRIAGNDYVQVLGSVYKIRTTKIWHLLNDADRLARAEALLRELGEYFDNYADVTDSDRGVAEVPNEAMEWKSRIDAYLSDD